MKPGERIDPLVHYAGRVAVSFVDGPGSTTVSALAPLVDHDGQVVKSSTGELRLDYGRGVLTLNAARAQGVSGALKQAGVTDLRDLQISSDLELGHIIAVSLDDKPLASAGRILLQVMSEEKESNRQTEAVTASVKRIVNIGGDPWRVKDLSGSVRFKSANASGLKIQPLDFNGYPAGKSSSGPDLRLDHSTMYYLISR